MKKQSGVINWRNLSLDDATKIRVLELLESLKEELSFEHRAVDQTVFTKAMNQIMDSVVSKIDSFHHTELVQSIKTITSIIINSSLHLAPSRFNNAWIQAATKKLNDFTTEELATSIDAITSLGLDDSPESQVFGHAWIEAATKKLNEFTTEELAISIEAIASLGYHESREFEHAWITTVTQKLNEFTTEELVTIIRAMGNLGDDESQAFEREWIKVATKKLNEFIPEELAMIVHAVDNLWYDDNGAFERKWIRVATKKLNEFTPKELEIIVRAIDTLWHDYDREFEREWIRVATKKLNEFTTEELSMSISIIADLKRQYYSKDNREFEHAWIEAATQKLNEFKPKDLAISISAVAELRYKYHSKDNREFEHAWIEAATQKLDEFKPKDLAISISAVADLGHHESKEFEREWIEAATNKLNGFEPKDLAISISAIAELRHKHHSKDNREFEHAWIEAATQKLNEFKPKDLAISISAVADLGHHESKEFENAWIEAVTQKLNEFRPKDLAISISAVAKLGHDRNKEFERGIFEHAWIKAATQKLNEFRPKDLAISISAIDNLRNHDSKEFEHAWIRVATQKLNEFKPKDLAISISAIANLKYDIQEFASELINVMTDQFGADSNTKELRNIKDAIDELLHAMPYNTRDFINQLTQIVRSKLGNEAKELAIIQSALHTLWYYDSKEFEHAWIKAATKKLNGFQPKDLAISMCALAKLGHVDSKEFEREWIKAATKKLNGFQPKDLAMSGHALAQLSNPFVSFNYDEKFEYKWVKAVMRKVNILESFVDNHTDASFTALALIATTMNKLDTFNAADLAMIINTIGNLKHCDSTEFEHAWSEAAAKKLNEFKTADLAMSISAVAKLNMKWDNTNLIDQLISAATKKSNEFKSKELAIIISALADLKHSNMKLEKEWIESTTNKLKDLNTEDLVTSIRALTKLQLRISDAAFEYAWIQAAHLKLNEFKPEELAMSISALDKLKLKANNGESINVFLKKIAAAMRLSVKQLNIKLGLSDPLNNEPKYDVWIKEATNRLNEFTSEELAISISALAKIKLDPANIAFTDAWVEAAMCRLKNFSVADLAMSISAVAKLKLQPANIAFADAWVEVATNRLDRFNAEELKVIKLSLTVLKHNYKEFEDKLDKKLGSYDKMTRFLNLMRQQEEIGLEASGSASCNGRRKRNINGCQEEDEDNSLYEPLKESVTSEQARAAKIYIQVSMACILKNPDQFPIDNKSALNKIIEYNQHVGDIISEQKWNHSPREQEIVADHYLQAKQLMDVYKENTLLKPRQFISDDNYQIWLFDNGKQSMLVFKKDEQYGIYSQDYNYRQQLQTKEKLSFKELEDFIQEFFKLHSVDGNYQVWTLSDNVPAQFVDHVRKAMFWHPERVMPDVDILSKKHFNLIEGIPALVVRKLFLVHDQTPDIQALNVDFFEHGNISLRIELLHKALQFLNVIQIESIFAALKKYNINFDRTHLDGLSEHERSLLEIYYEKVTAKLGTHHVLNSEDLSALSWSSLVELLAKHHDINSKLADEIVSTTQDLYSKISKEAMLKGIVQQSLFIAPDAIRGIKSGDMSDAKQNVAMLAGDITINHLYSTLVSEVSPLLSPERAKLLNNLPVTSPIFKVCTVYSIVDLHKQLQKLPPDSERYSTIKHKLVEQYSTIGLIIAESLGFECNPLWIALSAEQFIDDVISFRQENHLDITFWEASAMRLGFEQDKLDQILQERDLAERNLALVNQINSQSSIPYGLTVVKTPELEKILQKAAYNAKHHTANISFGVYDNQNGFSEEKDNVFLDQGLGNNSNWHRLSTKYVRSTGLTAVYRNDQTDELIQNNFFVFFEPRAGSLALEFTKDWLQAIDQLNGSVVSSTNTEFTSYHTMTVQICALYPEMIHFPESKGTFSVRDYSKKMLTQYVIDDSMNYIIQDYTDMPSIVFTVHEKTTVNANDTNIIEIKSERCDANEYGEFYIADNAKYLQLTFNSNVDYSVLKLSAEQVELILYQGTVSPLNKSCGALIQLTDDVVTFNITTRGSICVPHYGTFLSLEWLSTTDLPRVIYSNKNTNTRSKVASFYDLELGDLGQILENLVRSSSTVHNIHITSLDNSVLRFIWYNNMGKNNVLNILGRLDGHAVSLQIQTNHDILQIFNDANQVEHVEIIHYDGRATIAHDLVLIKVFKGNTALADHHSLVANISDVYNWEYPLKISNMLYHDHVDAGVLVFRDLANHLFYHCFTRSNQIRINDINYFISSQKICAVSAKVDVLNGNQLIRYSSLISDLSHKMIGICFTQSASESVFGMQNNSLVINGIILEDIDNDTKLYFNDTEILRVEEIMSFL